MNNTMPEEQIEFMKKISNYMEVSNNMSKEEANDFAFRVWQNERFFKELFGYNKAIDDFERVMCDELKRYIDDQYYMGAGLKLHEFTRKLAKRLKDGGENDD